MSRASIALSRFGYGIRREDVPPSHALSFLTDQLDAFDPTPDELSGRANNSSKPGEILELLRQFRRRRQMQPDATMADNAMTMEMQRGPDPLAELPPEIQQSYRTAGQFFRDDVALRTNMAIRSETPFVERLVHFWSNHFSVSAQKPGTHYQVADHEFAAIRPHVLGKFGDMLKAAVLHPAMLLYLDQFQSVGPQSRFMQSRARRRQARQPGAQPRGLNENLAREILELHTLGVDGGYNQEDVTEFARALTGWTIQGIARIERFTEPKSNGAAFVPFAHEPGNRTVVGRTYRDQGAQQALSILDNLATHPSTARLIATKLARHFSGDVPPASLVARLEQTFLESDGDLARLTQTLIASPEVWVAEPVKFRQPYEWLISVLRFTGVDQLDARRMSGALNEIGQLPWRAASPAGYDDLEGSWAGPDALFRRIELAERMARNVRSNNILERAERAFPDGLTEHTKLWLSRAESGSQGLALLLVAPEMMRR